MYRQLVANSLITGANYGLVAVSFSLIYSAGRFFYLAHGAVYTASAYLVFTAASLLSLPAPIAITVGILGAVVLGAGMEICVHQPLRRKGSSSEILLLASLGFLVTIQNVISMVFGDATVRIGTHTIVEGLDIFGARITGIQLCSILLSLVLTITLAAWLRWTSVGRQMRAVANDYGLGLALGLDCDRVIASAFAIGSALVAIAAILSGYDTDLTPLMGFNAILMGVVAVIVGGIGSIPGAFLGGLLVSSIQQVAAFELPIQLQYGVLFAVLILFLLLRPQGIFGKPLRRTSV